MLLDAALAALFYLVLAPVGLALRLLGRDPLNRSFPTRKASLLVPADEPGRRPRLAAWLERRLASGERAAPAGKAPESEIYPLW